MTLQAQREGTEKRISVARRDYIQAVQVYNTELRTFPGRIWAAILYSDMAPRETFTQPASVAEPPQVNFHSGCWRAATVRPLDRGGPAAGRRRQRGRMGRAGAGGAGVSGPDTPLRRQH